MNDVSVYLIIWDLAYNEKIRFCHISDIPTTLSLLLARQLK